MEVYGITPLQNVRVRGVFLTCTSNTSLNKRDRQHHDNKLKYITILRMVVTMVTGHGEMHLIPANKRNGSSSNTWSSLSS